MHSVRPVVDKAREAKGLEISLLGQTLKQWTGVVRLVGDLNGIIADQAGAA